MQFSTSRSESTCGSYADREQEEELEQERELM